MRDPEPLIELRRALRRQGIWGPRAARLLQDWTEHAHESAAQRLADGATPAGAESAAWQALGAPRALATQAAYELARASWMGRHPWLAGLLLPFLGWLLTLALCIAIGIQCFRALPVNDQSLFGPQYVGVWETTINWLPWLLSIAWLAWLVRRMPGGWKLYWITGLVLTFLSTSLVCQIHPPTHGPNSGNFLLMASGLLGALLEPLLVWTHFIDQALLQGKVFHVGATWSWYQIALSLAGLIAVRWWSVAPARRVASAQ